MTEIKTNEQILAKNLGTTVEKLYNHGFADEALKAMQESNEQAVRVISEINIELMLLEDRVKGTDGDQVTKIRGMVQDFLHSQVMEKLKTPTK